MVKKKVDKSIAKNARAPVVAKNQVISQEVDFQGIQLKWQKEWAKAKIFEAKPGKNKFYCLEMFPYPSASYLHMGHEAPY